MRVLSIAVGIALLTGSAAAQQPAKSGGAAAQNNGLVQKASAPEASQKAVVLDGKMAAAAPQPKRAEQRPCFKDCPK
jgi:hypothetical protein